MISFLRSAMQMRGSLLLPRNMLNKYCFSATVPNNNVPQPLQPSAVNQSQGATTTVKKDSDSDSTNQVKEKSSEEEKLSPTAQKAIWASAIINHIINSKPPTTIQRSLRDEILDLTIQISPKQKIVLDDDYKKQMMAFFQKGVCIDTDVYDQQKVKNAVNQYGLVNFFPTNSISKLVFKLIKGRNPSILMGSSGIGKTLSIIMFIELAKHANRLKYLAYGKWVDKETAEKHKKQLERLQKLNLIGDYPKCWYWCMRQSLKQSEIRMKNLIELQLDQLDLPVTFKKQLSQCKNLEEFILKIKKEHPSQHQIFRMILIDEMNEVTSYMKQLNSRLNDEKKPLSQAQKQILNNYKQKIIPLINQYRDLGSNFMLSSPFNLQLEIFGKKDDPNKLSFNCFEYRQSNINQLQQYGNQLQKEAVKIEFVQFFLFILQSKCMGNPKKTQIFKLIKEKINFKTMIVKTYYRQEYVRQFFGEHFQSLAIQSLNQDNIQDFISELSKKFNQYCLEQCQKILKKFINSGNDQAIKKFKRKVIQIIQIHEKIYLSYGYDKIKLNAQWLQRKAQILSFGNGYEIPRNFTSLKTYLSEEYGNGNGLIPFRFIEDDEIVVFDWSAKDFIEIATPVLHPQGKSCQFQLDRPLQELAYGKDAAGKGVLTQLFLRTLQYSYPVIEFTTIAKQWRSGKKVAFEINGIQTFLIFDETSQNKQGVTIKQTQNEQIINVYNQNCLKRNLSKLLQISKLNPMKQYIGFPVKNPGINNLNTNSQNQLIDMIIIKYNDKDDRFEMTMINFITKKQLSENFQKAKKLLKDLLSKVSKDAKQVQTNSQIIPADPVKGTKKKTIIYKDRLVEDTNKYIINFAFACNDRVNHQDYQQVIGAEKAKISYFRLFDMKLARGFNEDINQTFYIWKSILRLC